MLAELGLDAISPKVAAVALGAGLGIAFGALAQRTGFCLRRGLVGGPEERPSALGTWAMALAVAIAGTAAMTASGLVDASGHRLLAGKLPVMAILIGGLLFGIGMVLARGCASRLTVLAGQGNLRALTALIVFAAVAQAAIKGALAPLRTSLGGLTIDIGAYATLGALPGGGLVWSGVLALALVALALRSGARPALLAGGAMIGALAPLGWLGTGWLLKDDFEPIPLESLAMTSAGAEALFWWIASTAIAPTFGVGFVGGVLAGSFLAALAAGALKLEAFTEATPTGRYLLGGALMGLGGVLAGGCTIGAGLAGVGLLSVAAMLALASIVAGALLARWLANSPAPSLGSLATAARAISL